MGRRNRKQVAPRAPQSTPAPVIEAQPPAPKPLRRVLMLPLPSQAAKDLTISIHTIVLALQKHLPKFGYELTEDGNEAELIVGHAGQTYGTRYVDVAHSHGLYPTASGQAETWHWRANVNVIDSLRSAKAITAPSQWVADIIRRDMNIDPFVIGWGIDTDQWSIGDNRGYVLWNKTRIDAVCNPQPLLDLATRYPKQLFMTTFGQGTPNVKTIGRVPFEQMKEHVRHAAVYLATTRETFGLGTLEAMAAGVPVLGYAHGAITDIVRHGVDGFLAQPGDAQGLASGLEYCLQHRETLGANARARALTYTWERVAQQFAQVYDSVLDAREPEYKAAVVIPCYNYARYLPDAVRSVFEQQTSYRYQVIIVDDGSSDESYNVALELGKQAPAHVDYHVLRQSNRGVAAARNRGVEHARASFICCLDSDDMLGSPLFLQTLADALDKDRTLGIAFTSLRVMNDAGEHAPQISKWPDGYDFDKMVKGFNQVPTCNMFRKEAWTRAGGYRKECEPSEDGNLWLRIGALGYKAEHVVREGWFLYRDHADSLSKRVPLPNWRNFAWVIDGNRPFASQGKAPQSSFPVRNYDTPIVSIIIPMGPAHGEIVYRALDSIEAQTERRWECIVINDGVPADKMAKLQRAYTWVKWHTTGGVGYGAAKARNIGLHEAKAPLVTFLDADDYLHPRYLEKTIQAHRRSGNYIYTDWLSLTKDGKKEIHQTEEFDGRTLFIKGGSIHSINVLVPTKAALAVGGFDESIETWEDPDFFMKLAIYGMCGERLPEALFAYDYNSGTQREKAETIKRQLKDTLYARYREYIEGIKMCCGKPNKPAPVVSMKAANGASAVNAQFGASVMCEYRGPTAGIELIGAATRHHYGYRQNGESFLVWEKDIQAMPKTFIPMIAPEKDIEPTVLPPAPQLIGT